MNKFEQKNNSLRMGFSNMIQTRQKMLCKKVQNTTNSKELNNKNQDSSLTRHKDIKNKMKKT